MKPTPQMPKPVFRGTRAEMLADLLLDEVDIEPADLDDGLLFDVGLGGHGRGGFADLGSDDGGRLWR